MSGINSENEITSTIIETLSEGNRIGFQNVLEELQPFDLSQQYKNLPIKHKNKFLLYLTIKQTTDLIKALDKMDKLDTLYKLGVEKSTKVLDMMGNDDLADLLTDLSEDKIEELLSEMKHEESIIVQNLMKYPPETAGRLMNDRYVWIPQHYTVKQAVEKLKSFAELAEFLNYLYIIDNNRKLMGVVSYRDLILSEAEDKIKDLMYTRVVKVEAETDQEEVAKLISQYDFVSIPVVNEKNDLLGIITVDDIIDVMIQEANEDIEKLSAGGKAIDFNTPPLIAAWRRLPWLILLLMIGLISAQIIQGFSEALEKVVAIGFFIPMISGMTGNTGTQSLAVVVRGLTSNDLDLKQVLKLIFRELRVGIIIGLVCAIFITLITYVWQGNWTLGLVIGSSLFITLIVGTLSGTIIPLVLYKFKIDPAVASGPLITTINDIISLLIYFGIATHFLAGLVG